MTGNDPARSVSPPPQPRGKDRSRFARELAACMAAAGISPEGSVLIVGGGMEDAEILASLGLRRITLSNIGGLSHPVALPGLQLSTVAADAEDLNLADGSYDLVLAHEVLHHCRSPHRALLEMLRVSRRHVIILEPNESALMRLLVRLRLSFPYELPAVIANGFREGGVRNTSIPNYIHRWSPRDLYQTVAASRPESPVRLYTRQYWDFNVGREELALRRQTRIGLLLRLMGPSPLLVALKGFQAVANRTPWLGRQGNKFFGCVTKSTDLWPWLTTQQGSVVFRRAFAAPPKQEKVGPGEHFSARDRTASGEMP
jgi:SAM-dependent methyltransferase